MMWEREDADRRRIAAWEFELRGDELADIRFHERPVLRSIRAVVRDRDWNTIGLVVDRVTAAETSVMLHVRTAEDRMPLRGIVRAEVRGGSLRVLCDLEAASPVETNRTGLVALIPPAAAGARLAVGHANGSTSETALPVGISPHQPVQDIATLRWHDAGLAIAIAFDGDVFEMEDQRNWTDASFKVYSRPLALPFPYGLHAGERVVQALTITADVSAPAAVRDTGITSTGPESTGPASTGLENTGPESTGPANTVASIRLEPCGPFPAIGLGASTAPDPAPRAAAADDPAPVATALVELDLAWPGWPAALARAASEGPPLDARLVLPVEVGASAEDDAAAEAALAQAVDALRSHRVARVTAFQPAGPARHVSDAAAVELLRRALDAGGLDAPVVGGSRAHFTELNREQHWLPADLAGIVFGLTPLFHSRDTEQLVESLPMQRLVAAQAVDIAGGAPVHIGPITLRPHFNDVATTAPPRPAASDLSGGYGTHLTDADDPRQATGELAAWTIASAAALAVPGVASATYYERWGPRGILTSAGDTLPVAAAIRALAGLSWREAASGGSADGLVWALATESRSGATVIAANLDRRPRRVELIVAGRPAAMDIPAGDWRRLDLEREP